MQYLDTILAHPWESTIAAIGLVILGPPMVRIAREFWTPKVTRLRKAVAEKIAPKTL